MIPAVEYHAHGIASDLLSTRLKLTALHESRGGLNRARTTHHSTTDPDARLYKKGDDEKSRLCYMGRALMENRNGLVVDVQTPTPAGRPSVKRRWQWPVAVHR